MQETKPKNHYRSRKLARLTEPFYLLQNIVRGNIIHNWPGAVHVMRLLTIHKMPAGLLQEDHPWVTGLVPGTNTFIWPLNTVFKTPVATQWQEPDYDPDTDEEIVTKVGKFLASMVRKSVVEPEIPHGPQRRMPHAINYLHGPVHYNGVTLLFNNFAEALGYVADPKFRQELKRLIREEKREVTFIFRERNYNPVEFAYFSCFVMSHLPWFANVNGGQRRVMWGNPSPYPALNIINGAWMTDTDNLRIGRTQNLIRPPLQPGLYFQESYGCPTRGYHFIEKMHAYLLNDWVRKRGFDAGLYFVDRKKIEPQRYLQYLQAGKKIEPLNHEIPSPLEEKKVRVSGKLRKLMFRK